MTTAWGDAREGLGRVAGTVALLVVLPPVLTVTPGLPDVLGSSYFVNLFDDVVIFSLLGIALNVAFGHTDQLFLFVGGLAGVGAYTTTLVASVLGIPAAVALVAGVVLAGLIGLLVSWVAARREFSVVLISILTLNLQLALNELFVGARDLTGGSTGRPFAGLGLDAVAGTIGVASNVVLYYVLLGVLGLALVGYVRLIDSKYGLAFDSIREDEVAAESIGIDVVRYKVVAGTLSAATIGLVGVFYAQRTGYILPSQFSFASVDALVLIMLIVGGLRTTLGPVIGAALVFWFQEWLRGAFGEWETAVFGALLIVLFLYFRRGIVPAAGEWLADRRRTAG